MKIDKKRRLLSLILAVFFVFITITNLDWFTNQYDSLVGFIADNHSDVIMADKPATINFRVSDDNFEYCYLVLTPDTERAQPTTVAITMLAGGQQVFRQEYQDGNLFLSKYLNITPDTDIPKGTECSIIIESDAVAEGTGYRLLLGNSVKSDITGWYCGDVQQDMVSSPELHMIYPDHFGTNTFIVYCLCLLIILLLPLIPKFRFEEKLNWLVSIAALPASSLIILYFIEILSNNSIRYIPFRVMLCNYMIVLGAQLLITALTGRAHIAVILTALFGFAAGTINHFVLMYRGTPVVPIDVIAAGVAMDVISNYTFTIDIQILISAAVIAAGCVIAARYPVRLNIKKAFQAIIRAVCGVASCAILIFFCSKASVGWSGAYTFFRDAIPFYKMNGFLYGFVQTMHNMAMDPPADYDGNAVAHIMSGYTGTDGKSDVQPDIILIMSETWADFSIITDVSSFSTDPMPYLHSVAQDDNPNTLVGSTVVPVFGSGTCNSEFEAITGLSMANFTTYSFPYLQYVDDSTPALSKYLKEQGYSTYALHPGLPESWARDRVYKYFEFDEIYFGENFPYQEMRHEMISDGACFNSILDLLPQDSAADPAFIFNVTIRNHGGYDKNTDFDIRVNVENTDGKYSDAERFASLMLYSDEEMQQFIAQLEKRERPTVLVMFGDHLPSLSEDYYSYIHMAQAEAANPLARYTTPYFVWANYDIDTADIPQTVSSNYIGLMAMKLAGLPLNGWYQYLDAQMAKTPVYSLYGTKDVYGNFVDISQYDYQRVQYTIFRKNNIIPKGFW